MFDNTDDQQLQQQQAGADTPLNDESGEGATDGSGVVKGGDEERDYEGGALGSAGSGTQLKQDKSELDRGIKPVTNSTEASNNAALSPGIDRDERDYEGGALGSAGSGTGTLDENELTKSD